MAVADPLPQLAQDVERLIQALGRVVEERDRLGRALGSVGEERDRLRSRVGELEAALLAAQQQAPTAKTTPAPAGATDNAADDALMEHVEHLEAERAQIRDRLSRLLGRLQEADLVE